MSDFRFESLLKELADGRTELVLDFVAEGYPANARNREGVSPRCAESA